MWNIWDILWAPFKFIGRCLKHSLMSLMGLIIVWGIVFIIFKLTIW
mgnify:CR=1 FL=1|jgi:hypothetical protein